MMYRHAEKAERDLEILGRLVGAGLCLSTLMKETMQDEFVVVDVPQMNLLVCLAMFGLHHVFIVDLAAQLGRIPSLPLQIENDLVENPISCGCHLIIELGHLLPEFARMYLQGR